MEAKYLHVSVPVRYEEEDMPNDFPLRKGDVWNALIDLHGKRIVDWPHGKAGSFYMKVCDSGVYTLQDVDFNGLATRRDYVPNKLLPGEYGDYLALDIDEAGIITNWLPNANLSEFEE